MKIIFAFVACALIAAVSADYYPGDNGKCDFRCADIEVPLCAYNGRCYQRFQNNCFMDHYNCVNIKGFSFRPADDFYCETPARRCPLFFYNYNDYLIAGNKA